MTMQASDCPLYETIVAEGRQATAEEIREWLDTLFTHEEIGKWLTSCVFDCHVESVSYSFLEMVNHPSNNEKHGESNAPSGLWAHIGMVRMMHDLCKKETAAPSKKKVWDDGTPQDTNFKHGPLAAKLFARWWNPNASTSPEIEYMIEVHMDAHSMMEFAMKGIETGEWPKNRDFRVLPEELQPLVGDAEAWDWPEHADFPIELQNVWDKQTYNRCRMWNCRLLRIFQRCDAAGRFDDPRITS